MVLTARVIAPPKRTDAVKADGFRVGKQGGDSHENIIS